MASNFLADDDALVGVFTDLHPPGYQEEVQTTEANVQSGFQNEPTPVEFMKHFRPELVTHPGTTAPEYVIGRHPYWDCHNNTMLLVDPVIRNDIALFDYEFNAVWFKSLGYLRKNPRNPSDYKFCFDPHFEPYKALEKKGFECSKLGLLDFTNQFDLKGELDKASQRVKDIFSHKSMEFDGEENIPRNTKTVLMWISEIIYKEFSKEFGLTPDTVKNLPGKDECDIICKKIEIISPGLTQRKDETTNKIVDLPLKDAILRRFHYENRKRRDELQIPVTRKKPDSVFLCDFCQEEYDTLEELERHQVGVHGTITFHRPNETSIQEPAEVATPGTSGTSTQVIRQPQKKKKSDITENALYDTTNFVVDLTAEELEKATKFLLSFDIHVNTLEELFENTKALQRQFLHLPLGEQLAKFPWLHHAGFQIKLFSYIMFEKFGDDDGVPKNADQHFIETATDWILACFKFFMKNKQLTGPDAQQITDAASFSEKVIFVHESVDAYFGSNLFKKIEPTTTEDNIVSQAKTPLPSVLLSESGYQRLYVTYNGRLLGKFTREGAVAALTLQFATLYNFGVSFTHSGKNKALAKKFQNYFDFCTVKEWEIRTKFQSSGTGKPIQRRVSGDCQKLFDAIAKKPK